MRRSAFLLAAYLFVAIASPAVAGDAKAQAELQWAQGVAQDFLESLTDNSVVDYGLLTPELRQALDLGTLLPRFVTDRTKAYESYQITSSRMAPDCNEARISGVLKDRRSRDVRDVAFVLRVAKDTKNGVWTIRSIQLKQRAAEKK